MTLRAQAPDAPLEPENVQIADAYPPPLDGGTYTLTVTQQIPSDDVRYAQSYDVVVGGPRFSLDPAVVHARFPARDARGVFANYLPQIVFTRSTLPWERTLDGSAPVRGQAPAPFLALLVVDGDGPAPQARPVADLRRPGGTTTGPAVGLDPGESDDDRCVTVDLDRELFLKIVPRLDDLPYLAHARRVDVSAKPTPVPVLDGWFSVVVANRFPAATGKSTVYLVSLEGFAGYLPSSTAGPKKPLGDSVRLAVLDSWSFTDRRAAGDFKVLMQRLSPGPLAIPAAGGTATEAGRDAAAALAMGFGAYDHTTRQGEGAVSWYRGPLVPLPVRQERVRTWSASDAALRFDPARGMLDVSYASAWQLGRLLALGDTQFGRTLVEWRRANQRSVVHLAQRLRVARALPMLRSGVSTRELRSTHFVRDRVSDLLAERIGPALLGHATTRRER